jgi:hypothetical protein
MCPHASDVPHYRPRNLAGFGLGLRQPNGRSNTVSAELTLEYSRRVMKIR